jgi:hypothetical protein
MLAWGSARVEATSFSSNSANWGGGVASTSGGDLEISRSSFVDNSATVFGGAVVLGGGSPLSVVSSTFFGNSADVGGAVEAESAGAVSLLHCTVAHNMATSSGGAISGAAGLTIANSILWDNGASVIADSGAQSLAVSYSDIEGGHAGDGNIDADPLFVDLEGGDLHLGAGSPCIDQADGSLAPSTDLEGNERVDDPAAPNGAGCAGACADLGAFEYQPPS